METHNNMTSQNTTSVAVSPKRFFIVIGTILCATLLVIGFIVFQGSRDKEPQRVTFTVDETTQTALEAKTVEFLEEAGNFGTDYSDLNGNTAYNISRILKLGSSDKSTFFKARSVPYNNLMYKTNMLAQSSPVSFPQTSVEQWEVPYELENMMKYEVKKVTATSSDEGYVSDDGAEERLVTVNALLDSTVSKVVQTATDSSWDGTYDRMEKQFNQVSVAVTFAERDGQWLVYEVNMNLPFLLAVWNNPTYDAMAEDMFGFTTVETYVPKVSPQEAFKTQS